MEAPGANWKLKPETKYWFSPEREECDDMDQWTGTGTMNEQVYYVCVSISPSSNGEQQPTSSFLPRGRHWHSLTRVASIVGWSVVGWLTFAADLSGFFLPAAKVTLQLLRLVGRLWTKLPTCWSDMCVPISLSSNAEQSPTSSFLPPGWRWYSLTCVASMVGESIVGWTTFATDCIVSCIFSLFRLIRRLWGRLPTGKVRPTFKTADQPGCAVDVSGHSERSAAAKVCPHRQQCDRHPLPSKFQVLPDSSAYCCLESRTLFHATIS